jgi:BirA family biotin operon repressor/biotin-[acetyl-CoA-carboxylase] ligase
MSLPERLDPVRLRESLGKQVLGRRIIVLESTKSSNDFILQMLTPELPEGLVVFAEEQTAARGQRGNSWAAAPGLGLWFSFLLRPRLPITESARLTTWAARAIAETIRAQCRLEPAIKAPNDVYVDGRKVSGVLVDTRAGRGTDFDAVVGIGININHRPEDFPDELRERASSLALFVGKEIDRTEFAVALLRQLEKTKDF